MLKKWGLVVVLFLSTFAFTSSVFAITPSQQQINQFKNLPRAQQEALAKQMGVNISDFELSSQSRLGENDLSEYDYQVLRDVNESQISERLSEQSAVKELTAELKPFGYSLFAASEDTQSRVSFAPSNNTPVPADYVMGPGDSVNVQLFGKETRQFELFVNNEGTVLVPDLGPMSVVGLTYQQLKKELTEKYKQQVIGVTPHITMGKLRTIQIYLVGEAYRPGAITLSSLSTITHALFASGGINEIGSLRNIQLKRAGKTIAHFDLYELLVFGNTQNDKRLQQGDVIFIPTIQKVVSIDGNVRRPAIYEAKGKETLRELIAIAGGALPSGAMDMVQIARKTQQSGLEVITVDLLNKAKQSALLENGDYINIPDANDELSNVVVISGAYATPGLIQWRQGLSLASVINKNSLLDSTDLNYGIIFRRDKFASQSEIIQFEPGKVLTGSFNLKLNQFDQITLFNRYNAEEEVEEETAGGIKDDFRKNVNTDFSKNLEEDELETDIDLLVLETASFTDKQLFLKKTKVFSRKQLLAPIIARLKDEGTYSFPVKIAEITGQVKYPGLYPISRNGRVRDIILASGGLIESAYMTKAELSRTQNGKNEAFNVQHIDLNLVNVLLSQPIDNHLLVSRDTINVLQAPDWYDNRKVELIGEVVFPGVYQIKKNETLAQIIKRAGGLTNEASAKAAIFTREELKERERVNIDKTVEELRQQIISSNVSGSQNVKTIDYEDAKLILEELLSVETVGRLVIDLPGVVLGNVTLDVKLKDGDKLYIPSISPSVSVIGEVFVSSTHLLEENITLDEYIERSGGFTERADGSKVYVVKANGSVKVPSNNFWFDGESLILEPGDTIVVPRDVVNYERIGLWQTISQIVYQSSIALIAIGNL